MVRKLKKEYQEFLGIESSEITVIKDNTKIEIISSYNRCLIDFKSEEKLNEWTDRFCEPIGSLEEVLKDTYDDINMFIKTYGYNIQISVKDLDINKIRQAAINDYLKEQE